MWMFVFAAFWMFGEICSVVNCDTRRHPQGSGGHSKGTRTLCWIVGLRIWKVFESEKEDPLTDLIGGKTFEPREKVSSACSPCVEEALDSTVVLVQNSWPDIVERVYGTFQSFQWSTEFTWLLSPEARVMEVVKRPQESGNMESNCGENNTTRICSSESPNEKLPSKLGRYWVINPITECHVDFNDCSTCTRIQQARKQMKVKLSWGSLHFTQAQTELVKLMLFLPSQKAVSLESSAERLLSLTSCSENVPAPKLYLCKEKSSATSCNCGTELPCQLQQWFNSL